MTVLHVIGHIAYLAAIALLWVWAVIGSLIVAAVLVGTVLEFRHRRIARRRMEVLARLQAIREYQDAVQQLYDQTADDPDFSAWEREVAS